MTIEIKRIHPSKLKARQKENYNFQKAAAVLADYGFNCMRLTDDWEGADFLAVHIDGETVLRVQLKSRLSIAEKYEGKNIWIMFPSLENWFLVPHDTLVDIMEGMGVASNWRAKGKYSRRGQSPKIRESLAQFAIE